MSQTLELLSANSGHRKPRRGGVSTNSILKIESLEPN